MNPDTGEIREFASQEEATAAGFTVPLKCKPKPSCKKCYGRGWIGTNDSGQHVACVCTQRASQQKIEEELAAIKAKFDAAQAELVAAELVAKA